MVEILTVSPKGQITIPATLREKYAIKAGDRILLEPHDTGFFVKKPIDIFSLEGFLSCGHIPDNEEDLLTPEMGRQITERE
jgi:AbrB family looped-hinge helix DNA binding protein